MLGWKEQHPSKDAGKIGSGGPRKWIPPLATERGKIYSAVFARMRFLPDRKPRHRFNLELVQSLLLFKSVRTEISLNSGRGEPQSKAGCF